MGVLDFLWQGSPPPAVNTYGVATQNIPQYMSDYVQGLLNKTNAVASTDFQTYGAPRVAGFTPDQTQAFDNTREMQGQWSPYMTSANNFAQSAGNSDVLGAAQPMINQASGTFTGGNVSSYMNPFIQNVTDRAGTLAARNLNEKLIPAIGDNFTRAGQFGSSRMMGEVGNALRDTNDSMTEQIGTTLAQGYNSAGQMFGADQSRLGNLAQLTGNLSNMNARNDLDAASAMSGLGQQTQALGLRDAAALEGVGQSQQQLNQKNADVAYQDFVQQRDYPKTQLEFMNNMVRGLPSSTTTTSTQNAPGNNFSASPLQQVAGSLSLLGGLSQLKFAKGGQVQTPDQPQMPQRPQMPPRRPVNMATARPQMRAYMGPMRGARPQGQAQSPLAQLGA